MITVEIDFDPNQAGQFSDEIDVASDGEEADVGVAGSAGAPGVLRFASERRFGAVQGGRRPQKASL